MPPGRKFDARLIPIIAIAVVVADYSAKQYALANLMHGVLQPLMPPLLGLTLVNNTGTAFGMWRSQKFVGLLIPPLICAGIIYWIWKRERSDTPLHPAEIAGFGMILGGAIGNLIDRITKGQVTDFLYFMFWPSFPVFNLADVFIDIGVGLVLLHAILAGKHEGGAKHD